LTTISEKSQRIPSTAQVKLYEEHNEWISFQGAQVWERRVCPCCANVSNASFVAIMVTCQNILNGPDVLSGLREGQDDVPNETDEGSEDGAILDRDVRHVDVLRQKPDLPVESRTIRTNKQTSLSWELARKTKQLSLWSQPKSSSVPRELRGTRSWKPEAGSRQWRRSAAVVAQTQLCQTESSDRCCRLVDRTLRLSTFKTTTTMKIILRNKPFRPGKSFSSAM
jgi:hypothetical protein